MKILITGGNGLVGKSLFNLIDEKSSHIYKFTNSKECDLRIFTHADNLFNTFRPDIVVHLASRVGGLFANQTHNLEFLLDNVKINGNIIELCNKYNVKKLINILSTCIFPDIIDYPITSDKLHIGLPHQSNIGYAFSKRLLHVGSNLLKTTSVINLIPTNIYGEYDNYNLENSHVIPALIHKIHNTKYKDDLFMKGNGKNLRQFLYVDDLSKIILFFIDHSFDTNLDIIISPENEISIKSLTDIILTIFNKDINTIYENSDINNGQYKKTVSSNDIYKYIPDFKYTSIYDGLYKTINFFLSNYNIIRK